VANAEKLAELVTLTGYRL
jgi:hypothetical protein